MENLDHQLEGLRSRPRADHSAREIAATVARIEAQRALYNALLAEHGRCDDALS